MAVWERLRAQVLAKKGDNCCATHRICGDADLRKALAAYLCDFRAARCHPDQIVIVAGMQQAMLISAMAALDPGRRGVDRRPLLSGDPKGSYSWLASSSFQAGRQPGNRCRARPREPLPRTHLRHTFPSISSWDNDDLPAQGNRPARFCACARRVCFRRRLRRGVPFCRATVPFAARDR